MNISNYIGKPYIDKQYDCYGLIRDVYLNELLIELNPYGFLYASSGNTEESADAIKEVTQNDHGWVKVGKDDLQQFDVILFSVLGFVSHVGLYINDGLFLHCMKGRHTAIERLDSDQWANRYYGAVRWMA